MNRQQYDRIKELCGEMNGKLESAIDKLPQVTVPKDEVRFIARATWTHPAEQMYHTIMSRHPSRRFFTPVPQAAEAAPEDSPPKSYLTTLTMLANGLTAGPNLERALRHAIPNLGQFRVNIDAQNDIYKIDVSTPTPLSEENVREGLKENLISLMGFEN